MIRMLIVGYVFAIRSERRICAEVRVNLAYRWFCKLGIEDKIPDHSVFCRARHERFRESDALRRVFDDGFEIISVFSCLHGQNEGSSNVEKQMNPIGGMHQIFFRGAAHSTQCIARQTARQTARCLSWQTLTPPCAHLPASIPHVMLAQCCAARGAQYARRFLLIRRATTRPSCAQSNVMAPPSCAATVRCTNLLPKPSGIEGATTGGPPRSVHMTTTSSS